MTKASDAVLSRLEAARHENAAGAHELDDVEALHELEEGVELGGDAVEAQHERLGAVVDDLGVVLLADLQELGALVEGGLELDERGLGLDDLLTAVVDGAHDVDELRELLDDLLERLGIAAARDRHARELRVDRVGADDEALDVVTAPREHERDADEDARLVAHEDRDRVQGNGLGSGSGDVGNRGGRHVYVLP